MTHFTLKSWSHFFQAIKRGEKKHDLRDNSDRKFAVGDTLTLQEYDPFLGTYSGEECNVVVTYITSRDTPCAFSSSVLDRDFCILSLELQVKTATLIPGRGLHPEDTTIAPQDMMKMQAKTQISPKTWPVNRYSS